MIGELILITGTILLNVFLYSTIFTILLIVFLSIIYYIKEGTNVINKFRRRISQRNYG